MPYLKIKRSCSSIEASFSKDKAIWKNSKTKNKLFKTKIVILLMRNHNLIRRKSDRKTSKLSSYSHARAAAARSRMRPRFGDSAPGTSTCTPE